jgi:hypothetical protein
MILPGAGDDFWHHVSDPKLPTMFGSRGPWVFITGFNTAVLAGVPTIIKTFTVPAGLELYLHSFIHTYDPSVGFPGYGSLIEIFKNTERFFPYPVDENVRWQTSPPSHFNLMSLIQGAPVVSRVPLDFILPENSTLNYQVTYTAASTAEVTIFAIRRDVNRRSK